MPEMFAGGLVLLSLIPLALTGLGIAYIGLRIRDARSETPDPELGIKAAYSTFMSAGVLLALTGLTISAIDFLSEALEDKQQNQPPVMFGPPGKFNPQPMPRPQQDDPFDRISQRVAWPLVISGVLFGLISVLLIKGGTNDRQFPAVRRTFGGLRMTIGGLNVMVGVTLAIELLFQKDLASTKPFAYAIGLIGIWFPAAAVELFLLKRDVKLPYYVPPKPKKPKRRDDEFEDDRPAREERRERDDRGDRRETEKRPREKEADSGERRRPPRSHRDEDEEARD